MSFVFTKLGPPWLQMQGSITSIMFGSFLFVFFVSDTMELLLFSFPPHFFAAFFLLALFMFLLFFFFPCGTCRNFLIWNKCLWLELCCRVVWAACVSLLWFRVLNEPLSKSVSPCLSSCLWHPFLMAWETCRRPQPHFLFRRTPQFRKWVLRFNLIGAFVVMVTWLKLFIFCYY